INYAEAQLLSAGLLSQGNYSRIRNLENVRRMAYGAGGFLDIQFKDHWHIRPQLFYNQIGGNIGDNRSNTIPLRLHYFENQYSLSYAFEGNYWHYQVSTAVSAAYLWQVKYNRNPTYDLRWATHDFDLGWLLGFGLRYETGGWRWFSAELRHYWGRNSVFLNRFGFPVRNSVFSLRLAYSFLLRMR
ncbi:outer membrane beta-barrel protein, partial [Bernardetia sp.]|uniref:outer membrane beta-barrel protein n=1 Tax=Bernardetia sp. TaxID=1937974 RepID=UPI0025C25A99